MKSKKNCSNRDLTPKAISTEILKDQIFKKYFHSQLKKTDGKICSSFKEMYGACLEWNGNKNASGYGFIQVPQRLVKRLKRKAIGLYVHRLSYNFANPESVLEGYENTIDHLCKNRACCNPVHLECVSLSENVRRRDLGHWQKTKLDIELLSRKNDFILNQKLINKLNFN